MCVLWCFICLLRLFYELEIVMMCLFILYVWVLIKFVMCYFRIYVVDILRKFSYKVCYFYYLIIWGRIIVGVFGFFVFIFLMDIFYIKIIILVRFN